MNLLASGVVAEDYRRGARTEFMVTDGWNVSTSMAASNAQFGDSDNGIKTNSRAITR